MKSTIPAFLRSILYSLAVILLFSCVSNTTQPQQGNAKVVSRKNLLPDSTVGWLYYSIDGDSIVPPSEALTSKWDIKMAFLPGAQTRQIDMFLNSGTVGSGTTLGTVVSSRFDNLIDVPADSLLSADDTSQTGRIIPVALSGDSAMFIYTASTHTISPSPDKVLFIKTASGVHVKFQVTSIYLDAPASPTLDTPLGYYHFRYAKTTSGKW
ncbi:MAG: HmuY family protein [Ignavibacteria bacterium]|jgi:hypothetical protein|nr:HmuY family protein [Ignavibacteria bacterium]